MIENDEGIALTIKNVLFMFLFETIYLTNNLFRNFAREIIIDHKVPNDDTHIC